MERIDINMTEVEVQAQTRPLRATWTRETFGDLKIDLFGDLKIDLKHYSIESVFTALKRVGKIKELYGIGN